MRKPLTDDQIVEALAGRVDLGTKMGLTEALSRGYAVVEINDEAIVLEKDKAGETASMQLDL